VRKVYYLSTCSTSKRIISTLDLRNNNFEFQDIKFEPISAGQLADMHKLSGSYEALFSKIARKYKELGLKDQNLQEADYKKYILQEYTFLKRPVVIIDDTIFIGSGKANIANLAQAL
jgi:arsenate reductase (glutaredoxin)